MLWHMILEHHLTLQLDLANVLVLIERIEEANVLARLWNTVLVLLVEIQHDGQTSVCLRLLLLVVKMTTKA